MGCWCGFGMVQHDIAGRPLFLHRTMDKLHKSIEGGPPPPGLPTRSGHDEDAAAVADVAAVAAATAAAESTIEVQTLPFAPTRAVHHWSDGRVGVRQSSLIT